MHTFLLTGPLQRGIESRVCAQFCGLNDTMMPLFKLIVTTILGVLLVGGCRRESEGNSVGPAKVRVGYIGLTCEAPIFTAVWAPLTLGT